MFNINLIHSLSPISVLTTGLSSSSTPISTFSSLSSGSNSNSFSSSSSSNSTYPSSSTPKTLQLIKSELDDHHHQQQQKQQQWQSFKKPTNSDSVKSSAKKPVSIKR